MNTATPLIPTLFHEPWWLNIASGGNYGVVEVSRNDQVVGSLPYMLKKRYGITTGSMPPLTHFLGPAIAEQEGSANTRFQKTLSITEELLAKLPPTSSFHVKCHRGITDAIAFQKAKFRTSVQFTYEIYPKPIDEIWKGILHKRRNVIRRAQKEIVYEDIKDPGEMIAFCKRNLDARELKSYYGMEILHKLVVASLERGCGRITGTRDRHGNLSTALFCVWDNGVYYFLVGTRSPNYYKGSLTLLAWEAIKDAVERNLVFDFHGISNSDSVSFYSGFGATIVPRYIARRETKMMSVARAVQHLIWPQNLYVN